MHSLLFNGISKQKLFYFKKYFRDEPDDDYITHSELFKFKSRLTNSTNNDGIQVAEIAKLLKYLSNFGRNLEMLLINCEINLI